MRVDMGVSPFRRQNAALYRFASANGRQALPFLPDRYGLPKFSLRVARLFHVWDQGMSGQLP
jgi:hypothetical protein